MKEGGLRMVKSFFLFGLIIVLLCSNVLARTRGLGLGIILSESVGISSKLWIGKHTAIDGAISWDSDSLRVHADHIYHDFNLIKIEKGELPIYYGIGARLDFGDYYATIFGVRIPVGLSYIFETAPIDIFFEVVPVFDLEPKTELNINAGIGIRYFFK